MDELAVRDKARDFLYDKATPLAKKMGFDTPALNSTVTLGVAYEAIDMVIRGLKHKKDKPINKKIT